MNKWEYKVVYGLYTKGEERFEEFEELKEMLNEKGEQGWELAGVLPIVSQGITNFEWFIFKRPKD